MTAVRQTIPPRNMHSISSWTRQMACCSDNTFSLNRMSDRIAVTLESGSIRITSYRMAITAMSGYPTANTNWKKSVTLGDTDDDYGIVELKSGLSETDLIAYPADDYKEGMKTTTNANNLSDGETDGNFSDEEPIEEPMYDQEEPMIEETEEAAAEDAASGR